MQLNAKQRALRATTHSVLQALKTHEIPASPSAQEIKQTGPFVHPTCTCGLRWDRPSPTAWTTVGVRSKPTAAICSMATT